MASQVVVTKTLNIQEIKEKNFVLSPSLYKRVNIKNKNVKKVRELLDRDLKSKDKGFEVGSTAYISESKYFFIRTKSLQETSFLPCYDKESIVPILPQAFKTYSLKEGDVLISKDSNIGEVVILDRDLLNYMPSGGIYRLPLSKWRYYLLAFLKSGFFKTQLNFLASRGATIRHAKTLFLDCLIPFPNQINPDEIVKYVELLTKAIINKEKEIRKKHQLILDKIERELLENQKQNKFEYRLPNVKDIKEVGRLDTGLYSEEFKRFDFLIRNYVNGFFTLTLQDLKGGNTPRQNNRIIGTGEFIWITPTNISQYGFLKNIEKISIKTKKYNINKDCLIVINRGNKEDLVRGFYYDYSLLGDGHHNQGCYRVENKSKYNLIFLASLLNSEFYRKFISTLSIGSKMPEIKISQIINIPFPNFPESKQREIAELYYNPIEYSISLKLDNFLEEDLRWNEKVGILQLDMSAKKLRESLDKVVHKIVMDEEVNIKFDFKNE